MQITNDLDKGANTMKRLSRLLGVTTLALAGCGGKKQDPKIIEALQETLDLDRSNFFPDFRVSDTYLANATALNIRIVYGGRLEGVDYGDAPGNLEVVSYKRYGKQQKYFFFIQPWVVAKAGAISYPPRPWGYRLFLKYNKIIAPLPYSDTEAVETVDYCLKSDYSKPLGYTPAPRLVEVCAHAEDIVKGNYTYTSY
jgi:hypothetical protein